jgi:hypothetical protein
MDRRSFLKSHEREHAGCGERCRHASDPVRAINFRSLSRKAWRDALIDDTDTC